MFKNVYKLWKWEEKRISLQCPSKCELTLTQNLATDMFQKNNNYIRSANTWRVGLNRICEYFFCKQCSIPSCSHLDGHLQYLLSCPISVYAYIQWRPLNIQQEALRWWKDTHVKALCWLTLPTRYSAFYTWKCVLYREVLFLCVTRL